MSQSPHLGKEMTFWDHLEELRGVIIRILIVVGIFTLLAFFFKEELFSFILAPRNPDFPTYKWLGWISSIFGSEPDSENAGVSLINTGLARQFSIHLQASLYCGLLLASPYVIYVLFGFVSPGLYETERRTVWKIVAAAYLMFVSGLALSYMLIFPLTFQFLGSYQVDTSVANLISIDSYMETLILISLLMGVMFELPVVAYFLGKAGLLSKQTMQTYRRHAFLFLLIAAAFITPTGDAVTLLAVTIPVYLLYEVSIRMLPREDSLEESIDPKSVKNTRYQNTL